MLKKLAKEEIMAEGVTLDELRFILNNINIDQIKELVTKSDEIKKQLDKLIIQAKEIKTQIDEGNVTQISIDKYEVQLDKYKTQYDQFLTQLNPLTALYDEFIDKHDKSNIPINLDVKIKQK